MKFVIYLLYRPFFIFAKSILILFKPLLSNKTKKWIGLRHEKTNLNFKDKKNVFCFHASSGEIEYAKSIIRELKLLEKKSTIVVTYSSPSAVKLFDNISHLVDAFIPIPWDQPNPLRLLIFQLNPRAFIFARTDLWPELIFQLSLNKIPTFVASFNPSLTFLNRLFNLVFLNHFSGIFCTHIQQASALKTNLSTSIHISAPGDTRFDQVFWRLAQPSQVLFSLDFNYAVLGSTWPEDEIHFIPILKSIIDQNCKIFWCPHEVGPENIQRIESILTEHNLNHQRFSNIFSNSTASLGEVIIVDQIGYLADLYRNASWAFVGGSFKAKVHSVMEPLCCAIPVITGPHIQNSPEALRYSQIIINDIRIVQVVHDSEEFLTALVQLKSLQLKDFKKILIGHLEQNRNASSACARIILERTQEILNS
ncbi:MAG: glycosyltransferase N-terminal domain-containing protein [Pseudobdellovibrio sp.]